MRGLEGLVPRPKPKTIRNKVADRAFGARGRCDLGIARAGPRGARPRFFAFAAVSHRPAHLLESGGGVDSERCALSALPSQSAWKLASMMRQYELVDRVRKYNPHTDEDLLNRAYVYAMRAHGAQKRASGDPYFTHPLEVAAILTEMRLDDATIVAAVLHDTIEDTGATRAEIDTLFGPEIGSLVDGLTKLKKLDLVSKRAAQAENFRKLLLAIAEDVRVLLVKLADRLHNMRTLHFVSPEKRARIAEETLDIYAPLAGRMGMQSLRDELENLSFKYMMPEAFAMVSTRLADLRDKNKELIATIENELTAGAVVARHQGAACAGGRSSPIRSGARWSASPSPSSNCPIFSAFASSSDSVDECYRVIGVVHTKWPVGARPLQGLHFHAEAERLPLHPHHGGRARPPARRIAGAHPRNARHRPPRHRRPCALQGRPRRARRRCCRTRATPING